MVNKKNKTWITMIILILIIFLFYRLFNLGLFATEQPCNLGAWSLISYDSVTGRLDINGDIQRRSVGCVGIGRAWNGEGGMEKLNELDCNNIGLPFYWYVPEVDCRVTNDDIYKFKYPFEYYGECYLTCGNPAGCGGVGLGAGQSSSHYNYSGNWDGRNFWWGIVGNGDASLTETCNGGIIIYIKSNTSQCQTTTCSLLGKQCGTFSDGCNSTINCGTCESGKSCVDGTCVINGCTENWQCSSWSACNNNQQTRTCSDSNNCGTIINKPITSQSCQIDDNCLYSFGDFCIELWMIFLLIGGIGVIVLLNKK